MYKYIEWEYDETRNLVKNLIDVLCGEVKEIGCKYQIQVDLKKVIVDLASFPDDEEVVFYMTLGYPLRFSCCRKVDFRRIYADAWTDIKVEVPAIGPRKVLPAKDPTYLSPDNDLRVYCEIYEYFKLNPCVPLYCGQFKKIKEAVEPGNIFTDKNEFDFVSRIVDRCVKLYFNYLVWCLFRFREKIVAEGKETFVITYNTENCVLDMTSALCPGFNDPEFFKTDGGIKIPALIEHEILYTELTSARYPYFVTTWSEDKGFKEKWMFFDELIEEAKRVINGPHPCSDYERKYPEIKRMMDLDDLYMFDLWDRFHLPFLEKDWFSENLGVDSFWVLFCFQGEDNKLKTREDAIIDFLMLDYSYESDGTDWKKCRKLEYYPKTSWGYLEKPDLTALEKSNPFWGYEKYGELKEETERRFAEIKKSKKQGND